MIRAERTCLLAAAVALIALTPRAFAVATAQESSSAATSPPTYQVSRQYVNSNSITVTGYNFDKLPFAVALQVIKKALTRPWSNAPADRHELVCQYTSKIGSHLDTMTCLTNAQHMVRHDRTQDSLWQAESRVALVAPGDENYTPAFLNSGRLYVQIAEYTNGSPIRAGAMKALLAKLPPANADYTLRVMDHGKPVLDYVIRNGDLVHVYHYIYKNGKPEQH